MSKINEEIRLVPTATFEGSLYQLYFFQMELEMTKNQRKILKLLKEFKNSILFHDLKELTTTDSNGYYKPLCLLKVIRKNQVGCIELIKENEDSFKTPDKKVKTADSKEKILRDLKKIHLKYNLALSWLIYERRSVRITKLQRKILNNAKKRNHDLYKRLKVLTLSKKQTLCTPMEILECLRQNTFELKELIDGKPKRKLNDEKTSLKNSSSKPLPLDTNYKYPTKTSKSIWTVKKR